MKKVNSLQDIKEQDYIMLEQPKPEKRFFNPFQILYNGILHHRQNKLEYTRNLREIQKSLSELQYTTKVNLQSMISDLRYFKPSFWNRAMSYFNKRNYCLCEIHYPDNVDVIRYFPMPKPFIVDIGGKWCLFSPKAFRYINDKPKLEFYANNSFAIVHNVTDVYKAPTIDSSTYKTVQTSKHVTDALKTDQDMDYNLWLIILGVAVLISLILGFMNWSSLAKILKAMNIK